MQRTTGGITQARLGTQWPELYECVILLLLQKENYKHCSFFGFGVFNAFFWKK
jgi:hypothetical protein